jgi:hypothetical protein
VLMILIVTGPSLTNPETMSGQTTCHHFWPLGLGLFSSYANPHTCPQFVLLFQLKANVCSGKLGWNATFLFPWLPLVCNELPFSALYYYLSFALGVLG